MTTHNKNCKMLRTTADRMLKELEKRIQAYNDTADVTLCIPKAVVFGSYMNHPEWNRISDLDVGICYEMRYKGERAYKVMKYETDLLQASAKVYERMANCEDGSTFGEWDMVVRNMFILLRNRSAWLNLVGGYDGAIYDDRWMELDVGRIRRE